MTDGVIKGAGNSYLMRGAPNLLAQYPTWEAAAQAMQAGTFPLDLLFNAAGWQTVGDFLNQATLLKAATAARYGLPATAVPDDAFNALLPEVGKNSKIISGSYVGTGASIHTIHVGFPPKIVLIEQYSVYSYAVDIGVFIDNCRGLQLLWNSSGLSGTVVPVDWSSGNGITIGDASTNVYFNGAGGDYNYVAIG